MNDEQLAARRAEIPVHCAACGGEFPGTMELHNGVCDECQNLTHGPNYRLIARLQDQERTIARLCAALDMFAMDRWGTTNPILVPDGDKTLQEAYYKALRRG